MVPSGHGCESLCKIALPVILAPAFDCSPTPVVNIRQTIHFPAQCNTSEKKLRQIFEAYGQVDRVSIMTDRETGRSRGFGFVEMANAEDGEKAIAALNGTQLGGRTLNVNEARPKVERGGGGGGGGGGRDRG